MSADHIFALFGIYSLCPLGFSEKSFLHSPGALFWHDCCMNPILDGGLRSVGERARRPQPTNTVYFIWSKPMWISPLWETNAAGGEMVDVAIES